MGFLFQSLKMKKFDEVSIQIFFLFAAAILVLFFLSPGVQGLDSTELTLASFGLGIAHPPGEVGYLLLAQSMSLLPLGDVGFRANVFSWGCFALCLLATFGVALQKTARPASWIALVTTLWVALGHGAVLQAIRAEVYALGSLLTLGVLFFSLNSKDQRHVFFGWACFAFLFLVHPLMALMTVPFLRFKKMHGSLLLGALVAILCLYLPIRSAQTTLWSFGSIRSMAAMVAFLKGDMYPAYAQGVTFEHWLKNVFQFWFFLKNLLGPMGIVGVVFLNIYGLFLDRPFFLKVLISGFILFFSLTLQNVFWPDNPDAFGYALGFVFCLAVSTTVALNAGIEKVSTRGQQVLFVLGLLGVFYQGSVSAVLANWSDDVTPLKHQTFLMEALPYQAQVETTTFETYSFMKYAQGIEGVRPDAMIYYSGLPHQKPPSGLMMDLIEPRFRQSGHTYQLNVSGADASNRRLCGIFLIEASKTFSEESCYKKVEQHVLDCHQNSYFCSSMVLSLLTKNRLWAKSQGQVILEKAYADLIQKTSQVRDPLLN